MQVGMTLFITGAAFMFFAPMIGIVRIDKTKFPFCLFKDINISRQIVLSRLIKNVFPRDIFNDAVPRKFHWTDSFRIHC